MSKDEAVDPRVERTRERVIEAAERLMREGGPSAVTYSALTRESGVGRATLYRHWPSLDDLWSELIRETATTMMFEPSGKLRSDLLEALRVMRDHLQTRVGLVQLLTMLERAQWDEQAAMLLRLTAEHNPIRQLMKRGRAADDPAAGAEADMAVALLTGPVLQRLMFGGTVDDDFLESVVDSYLEGPSRPGATPDR